MLFSCFFAPGCEKNESSNYSITQNPKLVTRSSVVSETYYYDEKYYTLYFYDDDTTGLPLNTSTADSLIDQIGTKDFEINYYSNSEGICYIEDLISGPEPDTSTIFLFPSAPCFLAEYFEHADFGGNSFCVDNYFNVHDVLTEQGQICSEIIGESNLANRPYSGGGSWNDKISSFKMFRDGFSRQWYIDNGYFGTNTGIRFSIHRDNNFSRGRCKNKHWTLVEPIHGGTTDPWLIPNLKSERWGFLCANLNDRVSSLAIGPCKCLYSGCLMVSY